MKFCRPIKFLNTTPLLLKVYRSRDHFGIEPKVQSIDLRQAKKEDWKSAQVMVQRIRRVMEEDIDANKVPLEIAEMTGVRLERVPSEVASPWQVEGADDTLRLVLPLETNPATFWHLGGGEERVHFEVGCLWWIKQDVWHSVTNFGTHSAVHLLVDFKVVQIVPPLAPQQGSARE